MIYNPYHIRRQFLLFLHIAAHILCSGCSTSSAPHVTSGQQPVLPMLLFQKTPCFGTCPAYNATIYTDGSASYVPYEHALAQDTLQLQLTVPELQQLRSRIEVLKYNGLQSSYLSSWSDISSTYLTFYENGKEVKRVKHQKGGPQELLALKTWLGELLEQRAQEKSTPAQ